MFIGDKDTNLHNVDLYTEEMMRGQAQQINRTEQANTLTQPTRPQQMQGNNNNNGDNGNDHSDREGGGDASQLPTAEEYKAQMGIVVSNGGQKKLLIWIAISAVGALLMVAMGIAIGRTEMSKELQSQLNQKGSDVIEDNSTPTDATPTDATPVDNTPSEPTESPVSSFYYKTLEVADFVSRQGWSNSDDAKTPGTPQYKAAEWIAHDDPQHLPIADTVHFRQRYILAVIFYSLSEDRGWAYDLSWLSEEHECNWYEMYSLKSSPSVATVHIGVNCGNTDTNVQDINLPGIGLIGIIPQEIVHLSDLVELNLRENSIYGSIPNLTPLGNLENLALRANDIKQPMPEWLGGMRKLRKLELGENELSGSLPSGIATLPNLVLLDLADNNLVGGISPLKGMPLLQAVYLSSNDLSGGFDDDVLLSWPAIELIDLGNNWLKGELPKSLFYKPELYVVDLHANYFNGTLPTDVAINSDLEFLALHENKLVGQIDEGVITSLTSLEHLDLSANKFTGSFPGFIGSVNPLKYLSLSFNSGFDKSAIPESIGNLTNLVDLSLQHTNRIGAIPSTLGKLSQLYLLDLNTNELTGYIPSGLGGMSSLKFLFLKKNMLSGYIPTELGGLSDLDKIVMDENKLTGNAKAICENRTKASRTAFITDCTVLDCPCCTYCCAETNSTTCNNQIWYDAFDHVDEYLKEQRYYVFHSNDIIYPIINNYDDDFDGES